MVYILFLNLAILVIAIVISVQLLMVTKSKITWSVVIVVLLFMIFMRSVATWDIVHNPKSVNVPIENLAIGLSVSLFILFVIIFIKPLFLKFKKTDGHIAIEKRKSEQEIISLSLFPQENPNPVMRVDFKYNLLYKNKAAEHIVAHCEVDRESCELFQLVKKSIEQKNIIRRDIKIGDIYYLVAITPILENEYVNIYANDITEKRKAEIELDKKNKDLTIINEISLELATLPASADINKYISDKLMKLTSAIYVGINHYNKETRQLEFVSANTSSKVINKVSEIIGRNLKSVKYDVDEKTYKEITGEVSGKRNTLHEASFGAIPEIASSIIHRLLKIDYIVGMALVVEGELLGTAIMVIRKGCPEVSLDLLRAFSNIASVSLRRRRAEKELVVSEEKFSKSFYISPDAIVINRLDDGKIVTVNNGFRQIMGYEEAEVIGKTTTELNFYKNPEERNIIIDLLKTTGQAIDIECWFLTKFGEEKLGMVSAAIVEIGGVKHIMSTSHDITERKQNEEKLKMSEERFRMLVETLPEFVAISDVDGKFIYLNRYADGFSEKDVIGTTIFDYIDKDNVDKYKKTYYNTIENNSIEFVEYKAYGDNKNMKSYECHFIPIVNDNKNVNIITVARDITERKQANKRIEESEKKYRNLAESIIDIVYSIDKNGLITHIGSQVSKYGLDSSEMIGRKFLEYVHPDDHRSLMYDFLKVIKTGKEILSQFRFVAKNGDSFWFEEIGSLHLDENGEIVNVTGVIRDITERKLAEKAIIESEGKYRLITKKISDVVWLMDLQGRSTFVSPSIEQFTGYTIEEYLQQTIQDRFTPQSAIVAMETFKQELYKYTNQSYQPKDYKITLDMDYLCKDGSVKTGEVLITPYFDENDVLIGLHGVTRDITERKLISDVHEFLLKCGLPGSGEDFFASLTKFLSNCLGMEYVCIDRLEGDGLTAHTIAIYNQNQFETNVSYALKETPCGDVVGKNICCFPENVCDLFPNDKALQDLKAVSYIGATLWSFDGKAIGLIALIGQKPMKNTTLVGTVLKQVAVRAAGELERKQAVEKIKNSEILLNQTGEIAKIGGWELNLENNILTWTKEVYIIHEVDEDFIPTVEKAIGFYNEESKLTITRAVENAIEIGEPFNFELGIITAKGNFKSVQAIGEAKKDSEGNVISVLGTFMDITERKQAEEKLRENEVQYRNLANYGSALIWTSGNDKLCNYFNEPWLKFTGRTLEQEMGNGWTEGVHPDDFEQCLKTYINAFDNHEAFEMEYRLKHNSGEYKWILDLGKPNYNRKGEFVGYIGYCFDITEKKKAEELIKENEFKLRSLVESLNSGVAVYEVKNNGNDFVFKDFNKGAEKIENLKSEDVIGKNVIDVFSGIIEFGLYDVFKEVYKTGVSMHHPISLYKDNRLQTWRDNFVYKLPTGEIVAVYEDVTEKMIATSEIKRASQIQTILKEILSYSIEEEHIEVILDKVLQRLFSIEWLAIETKGGIWLADNNNKELKLISHKNLSKEIIDECNHIPFGKCICGKAAKENGLIFTDCLDEKHDVRYDYIKPHGHYCLPISKGKTVLGVINLYLNQGHKYNEKEVEFLNSIANILSGIIERKKAEKELNENEMLLNSIIENSATGIVMTSLTGNMIRVNKTFCNLLGYNEAELIKKHFNDITYDEDKHIGLETVRNIINGNSNNEIIEKRYVHKNGNIIWVSLATILQTNPNTQEKHFLTSVLDITDRRKAQEVIINHTADLERMVEERTRLLKESNKELESFAYSVSHDLRAPLRHIDGFLELLQSRIEKNLDEKSLHYMDTIHNTARQMGVLIDELLSFSRMGRREMSLKSVSFEKIIQNIIKEFEPETGNRFIDFKIDKLPMVVCDDAMMRIVLTNLISNAIKYTRNENKAEIHIGFKADNDSDFIFFIKDNGVGFDMTYVNKLYGVFQRLHKADEFEGTGIGLANVNRIVSRHGGRCWAEGEVGVGATFYFTIPKQISLIID